MLIKDKDNSLKPQQEDKSCPVLIDIAKVPNKSTTDSEQVFVKSPLTRFLKHFATNSTKTTLCDGWLFGCYLMNHSWRYRLDETGCLRRE